MRIKKEHILVGISGLFLAFSLVGAGAGVYFYRQYRVSEEKLKNPAEAAKQESKELKEKVGKLMLLPSEDASVVTVADAENLKKTQVFFQDAKDGDKVLIFATAKKAVIYRPETNVVVNVAPIFSGDGTQASGSAQTQTLKIALRNGSGIIGIAGKLEDELKSKLQNMVIVEKDNAKRMDYEKTVVIVLTETLNKTVVQQLANELSATVSSLPSDEPKPAADLLIIAGKDRK